MSTETGGPVAAALDRVPVGKFHQRLLAVCGTAWAFDGMEVIIISFTLPALVAAWNLTGLNAGLLGSASLLGMVFGNWAWGRYADRYGRRTALAWTVLTYSVFTGLTALALGFPSAFLLRFLTGVGLGGALAVDTTYLTEHLPTSDRGRYLVYLDAFWPVGNVLAVALAWVFLAALPGGDGAVTVPVFGAVAGWRLLFVAAALPGFFVVVLRSTLGESPYYLARNGRLDEANERLRAIGADERSLLDDAPPSTTAPGYRRLFESDLRAQTLLAATAWFAINFGYYGVFIWLPKTVGAAGVVGNIYGYFLLVALVQFPGYASAAYLVERWGRPKTLGVYLALSGVFTFVFAASLPGVGFGISGFYPFVGGLLAASFFSLGAWGAIYAYTPELFPTEVRATGNGFAGGVGKLAAVLGPITAGALADASYLVALLPLAAAFAIGGIVVLAVGPETKGFSLR